MWDAGKSIGSPGPYQGMLNKSMILVCIRAEKWLIFVGLCPVWSHSDF